MIRRTIPVVLAAGVLASVAGCSLAGTVGVQGPANPTGPPSEPAEAVERGPARASYGPGNSALDRLPSEVRALWVVRTTLTNSDSIRAMVHRASESGFNTLFVQVRGRGDAYYTSRWEPKPESVLRQGEDFDPLATVIQEAHAWGLTVHAWVNAHLIGGMGGLPSHPLHLIQARPDLLAVPKELAQELFFADPYDYRFAEGLLDYARANQDRIEGLYSAPSHPEVKEHLYSVWMDLAESYELDGIHFDYIRYPSPDFDYSRHALDRFRRWVEPDLSPARLTELEAAYPGNALAFVDALPAKWDEFRRAQITELVERIYFGVKKRYPEILVSAAVFANAEDAYRSRYQDWRGWLNAGIIDVVAPMAYTPENQLFRQQIRTAVEAGGDRRVLAGIGVYRNTYQGTLDKIQIARDEGARGVVLFSYDWAISEGEPDGELSLLDRIGSAMFRRR